MFLSKTVLDHSIALVAIAFALVSVATNFASARQSDSIRFEEYLRGLQLNRLVIEHLESEIANELDRESRLQMAQRLVTLYTNELLDPSLSNGNAVAWSGKALALVKIYPVLENSRFRIGILQSRYSIAEKNFHAGYRPVFGEPGSESTADGLQNQLMTWLELERDLHQFNRQISARYQELVTTVQTSGADPQLNRELAQTEGLLLNSTFLLGWTNYFCGVLQPNERKKWMRQADEHLRDFFQIEPRKSLTEFSAKWFDFGSNWHVRGLVGLAMCQRGLDHPQQSQHCFALVQQIGGPTAHELLPIWEFESRFWLGQFPAAMQIVKRAQNESQLQGSGQIRFWTTLIDASEVVDHVDTNLAAEFRRAGLAGLVRKRQAPLIERYLERRSSAGAKKTMKPATGDPADRSDARDGDTEERRGSETTGIAEYGLSDDFLGNWISGYVEFTRAVSNNPRHSKTAATTDPIVVATLAEARKYLQTAVDRADAQTAPTDLARCRYLLATIDFQNRDFERAADQFNLVASSLTEADRVLAAEAQWFAAQSLIECSRHDNRLSTVAYSLLENLQRRFPESEFASRAKFEKLRLNLVTLPGDEAIRRLRRIDRTDASYPLALIEIARHQFQNWLAIYTAGQENADDKFSEFLVTVDTICDQELMRGEAKLAATLLAVDGILRKEPFNEIELQKYLDVATEFVNHLEKSDSEIKAEFHYYQLQFAEKMFQTESAKVHAVWLESNAVNTRFELPALIFLVQNLGQEFQQSRISKDRFFEGSLRLYRRLVQVLGTSREQLLDSANAQVALAKLAELELQAQHFEVAADAFGKLVDCFPNQQPYVRGLAVAKMKLESYQTAAPLWSKLSISAKPGTEEWFEAKHESIVCLLNTNRDAAEQLYRQTVRLSGEISPVWQLKFDSLGTKFQPRAESVE